MRTKAPPAFNIKLAILFLVVLLPLATPHAASNDSRAVKEGLQNYDLLEREAGKYGFIAAGAVRVIDFKNSKFQELQKEHLTILANVLQTWKSNVSTIQPNLVVASFSGKNRAIQLNIAPPAGAFNLASSNTASNTASNVDTNLESQVLNIAIQGNTALDPIAEVQHRLSFIKYIESQEENLLLNELVPPRTNYRRVMITMELTALVKPTKNGARAAMVLFDLYPHRGDVWCHKVGNGAKTKGVDYTRDWSNDVKQLVEAGTYDNTVTNLSSSCPFAGESNIVDYFAVAHRFLEEHDLLPVIVHVEPLDEGEVLSLVGVTNINTSVEASLSILARVLQASGGYAGAAAKGIAERLTDVNLLSIAFAAGSSRAGWLFFPSQASFQSGVMRPTERRIRLVVDVPRAMRRLSVDVHKMFLDSGLQPMCGFSFTRQIDGLRKARQVLNEMEKQYPTNADGFFLSHTHWGLVKSRLRNSSAQVWPESLDVQMPE